MSGSRRIHPARANWLLTLVLAALAMNAFVPAGYMVAPVQGHGIAITPCPTSNALARAVAAMRQEQGMAHHAAMDHAGVDHAAMGHGPAGGGDDDGAPAASQPKGDCAFSALGSPGTIPEKFALTSFAAVKAQALRAPYRVPDIVRSRYIRPPLRGPPAIV